MANYGKTQMIINKILKSLTKFIFDDILRTNTEDIVFTWEKAQNAFFHTFGNAL